MKKTLYIAALAFLFFRYFQAQGDFDRQRALFAQPAPGHWRAWVAEEPEVLFNHQEGRHDTGRKDGFYQSFVKEVRAVCVLKSREGVAVPPVKVRCTLRLDSEAPPVPLLSYGETVEIEGNLLIPPAAQNPGQFDYARYLKTRLIPYVLYASPREWRPVGTGGQDGWLYMEASCRLRRWAQDRIYSLLPFPQNALLDGILLGERGALPGEMVEAFMETGTVHILAVSGMITAFVAGILFILFRACQIPRKPSALLTLLGVVFFITLTGAHAPVCRAGLFAILALLSVLLERRIHGGVLLLATAWVLVAVNPFVLEDLSFQISFLATAGLMVMGRRIEERIQIGWKPVSGLLAATAAAQLSVWCLLIYSFNQLSLYSLPANLLIVPLALLSVAAGLAALAASCLIPFLGTLFAAGCDVVLKLLVWLAQWIYGWPGANFTVASPSLGWILVFHGLLIVTFYFTWPKVKPENPSNEWKRREMPFRKARRLLSWVWMLFLGASLIGWGVSNAWPRGYRVLFFAVGHGDAALLETPSGRVYALEGGWFNQGLSRYQTTAAYLRHRGISQIAGVVNLSPTDEDAGGLANLVQALPVSEAFGLPGEYPESWGCQAFLDALADKDLRLHPLRKGDSIPLLDGAALKVIYSPEGEKVSAAHNPNRSLGLLLTLPGAEGPVQILFAGNLGKEGIRAIGKDFSTLLHPDWLAAPRHGAESANPEEWARGLTPSHILVSDSRNHPADQEIYRLANPAAKVLCTALEGAVELEVGPGSRKRFRNYREGIWQNF
jgi:competence protein ComEC